MQISSYKTRSKVDWTRRAIDKVIDTVGERGGSDSGTYLQRLHVGCFRFLPLALAF